MAEQETTGAATPDTASGVTDTAPVQDAQQTPAAAAPETPAATPEFPAYLLRRAAEFQIPEDEARAYSTPEFLEKALQLHERQLLRYQRMHGQPSPQSTPSKEEPAEPDLSEFDPALVKYVKDMRVELANLRKQAEGFQNGFQSFQQQQLVQEFESFYDGWLASDGPGYSEKLGAKPLKEIWDGKTMTPELSERLALKTEYDKLVGLYLAAGQRPPSSRELMHQAAAIRYYKPAVAAAEDKARQELDTQLRNRAGQFTAKPGQKASPSLEEMPPSDEKAIRLARKFMKERGMLDRDLVS